MLLGLIYFLIMLAVVTLPIYFASYLILTLYVSFTRKTKDNKFHQTLARHFEFYQRFLDKVEADEGIKSVKKSLSLIITLLILFYIMSAGSIVKFIIFIVIAFLILKYIIKQTI